MLRGVPVEPPRACGAYDDGCRDDLRASRRTSGAYAWWFPRCGIGEAARGELQAAELQPEIDRWDRPTLLVIPASEHPLDERRARRVLRTHVRNVRVGVELVLPIGRVSGIPRIDDGAEQDVGRKRREPVDCNFLHLDERMIEGDEKRLSRIS